MGNPFVHVELMSTDVAKVKAFYGKLFDWKLQEMPGGEMDYTLIKVGEGTGGGIMKNPIPGRPQCGSEYVLVNDLKSTTDKAKSLGAQGDEGTNRRARHGSVHHHHRPCRRNAGAVEDKDGLDLPARANMEWILYLFGGGGAFFVAIGFV